MSRRADNLLLGLLVAKDLMTLDEATAIAKAYSTPTYDAPVPMDVTSGYSIALDLLAEVDDDIAIERMIRRDDPTVEEIEDAWTGDSEAPEEWFIQAYHDWALRGEVEQDCD